jgi:hypothetical protein
MLGPAATLPDGRGFRPSAWPELDPFTRRAFLNQVLVIRTDLDLSGRYVDFESSREPLLIDPITGAYVSLFGETVSNPTTSLVVDITRGTLVGSNTGLWLVAGAVLIVAAIYILKR